MSEEANYFDRAVVTRQLRSLLVLETAHMLVSGFVHHMLFREFSARYHCLLSKRQRSPSSEAPISTCHTILTTLQQRLEEDGQSCRPGSWAVGTHSVFFREKVRQQLDWYRMNKRQHAVTIIQRSVQKMLERKHQTTKQQIRMADRQQEWQQRKMSSDAINGEMTTNEMASGDSHHVPITHRYDVDFIKRTCCLHGLDMDVPPPVPVSRPYTVRGNMKLSFPHKRVVKQNYKDEKGNTVLYKGEQVDVVGASPQRGFMLVEHRGVSVHVPSHFLELKVSYFCLYA
jgi:dachs protein